MALSAEHNLDISTASTLYIRSIFSRKYFSILPGTGRICESIHSQIDGPSSGRSSKLLSRGATGVLAVSGSICFGGILRVLAVFPGSICSGYSGYCKVSISDVCTAGAACVLGVLYTAHYVPSTRSIWAFSTTDTPSTRIINLGHDNSRAPQYSQYQQYPEYRT